MQFRFVGASCRRILFCTAIAAISGSCLLAQDAQIPSNPPAAAQATTVPPAPNSAARVDPIPAGPQSPGWLEVAPLVIKSVGGVGVVVSLILIGFMMFRKFAPQYIAKRPADRTLRLMETLHMGDKRSLVLVQAEGRKLLLASTPGQIALLTSLGETGASLMPAPEESAELEPLPSGANFRKLYELERKSPPARPASRPPLPADIRGKMQELRKALER